MEWVLLLREKLEWLRQILGRLALSAEGDLSTEFDALMGRVEAEVT